MIAGEEPVDLWEVDSRRFAPWQNELPYLTDRVGEVLGHHYQLAFPTNEFHSSRHMRMTPVHIRYAAAGAVFGERLGWERPLVMDRSNETGHLAGSFGKAPWFERWREEHLAARNEVALFDQSSFARLQISGPDAFRLLSWACANDIDVEPGRIVYTPMLNRHGRYVSDLTITRQSHEEFMVMTAAIQPIHDRDWLDRLARERNLNVTITDVTAESAVLGLMGPRAPEVLSLIADGPLPATIGDFGSVTDIHIAGVSVAAARISYVGEPGWELHVAADQALTVFDIVTEAGRPKGLRLAGTMAMNSLRLEKGYVSWSHDVSRDDTPLEAGYGFTIAWDKPGGFLGRTALLEQRARRIERRLVWIRLLDSEPVLWGHEPILRDGQSVGFTLSGSYGHSVSASVTLGYLTCPGGISRDWVAAGAYEIDIAGTRIAAKAHWRSPL
jgi:glycine cleavage system aminomethyltransferase T